MPHSHAPVLYGILGPEIHRLVDVAYRLPVGPNQACDADCSRLPGDTALRVLPSILARSPPESPAVVIYDTGHVFNATQVVLPDVLVIDHQLYLLAATIANAFDIFQHTVPSLPEEYSAVDYYLQYLYPCTDYLQALLPVDDKDLRSAEAPTCLLHLSGCLHEGTPGAVCLGLHVYARPV